MGAGVAAVGCAPDAQTVATSAVVVHLSTGAVEPLQVAEPEFVQDIEFVAVGRRWLEIEQHYTKGYGRFYVNLRTGERRQIEGSREIPDLNAAQPVARLCPPVVRPRSGSDDDYSAVPCGEPAAGAGMVSWPERRSVAVATLGKRIAIYSRPLPPRGGRGDVSRTAPRG